MVVFLLFSVNFYIRRQEKIYLVFGVRFLMSVKNKENNSHSFHIYLLEPDKNKCQQSTYFVIIKTIRFF